MQDTVPGNVLREAERIITGARATDYGNDVEQHKVIAAAFNAAFGHNLKPHEVAALLVIVKLTRIGVSPVKRDHWVDIAGYADIGARLALSEQEAGHETADTGGPDGPDRG